MESCIFCEIIKKESPADIVYEDDEFIVFKDIKPQAPLDLLVVVKFSPEEHLSSVDDLQGKHREMMGKMMLLAKKIAHEQGIGDGYQIHFNVGKKAGQLIDHLHLHVWGGWKEEQ
jgi:histidine triad (HIT) family protein